MIYLSFYRYLTIIFNNKVFFPEAKWNKDIFQERSFVCISNLEAQYRLNNNLEQNKKFEPYEMGIYNSELKVYLNEKAKETLNSENEDLEILTSNFNSANMSPQYFSNDFNIYVRYLPVVKNISNIDFTDEKDLEKNITADSNLLKLNKKAPFSDLIDYKTTFNCINELKKIDHRMSQKKKISFDIKESNVSLMSNQKSSVQAPNMISSVITVTNLSEAYSNTQSALNSSIDSLNKISSSKSLQSSISNQKAEKNILLKSFSQYDLFKKIPIKILEPGHTSILNKNNNSNRLAAKKWQKIVKVLKNDKKLNKDVVNLSDYDLKKKKRNDQYYRTLNLYKFDLNTMKNGFNLKLENGPFLRDQNKISIKQIFVKSPIKVETKVNIFFNLQK